MTEAVQNDYLKMPDEPIGSDFKNLEPGLYLGKINGFSVAEEGEPRLYMGVDPFMEVSLRNPSHRKSAKKSYTKYDPQNLKVVGDAENPNDKPLRITYFMSEEPSRFASYYRNKDGNLKVVKYGEEMPEDAVKISQREENLIELSRRFALGGKEIPTHSADFLQNLAEFLDSEISGQVVCFQAKENGDYINYMFRARLSDDQVAQLERK